MTLSVGDKVAKVQKVEGNTEGGGGWIVSQELQRVFEVERIDTILEWNPLTGQQDHKLLVKLKEIE